MSKLLNHFIGIDISKQFFDVALLKIDHPEHISHQQFFQSLQGFEKMKQWLEGQDVFFDGETLICMEYTGIYNTSLINYLNLQEAQIWVEMALKIKRTQGFSRSSNDKIDAIAIAKYACRYQDNCQLWTPTDENLNRIKQLIAQRDRLVSAISRLVIPIEEMKECGLQSDVLQMQKLQKPVIIQLEKTKQKIESLMLNILNDDKNLLQKARRIQSIKGIGKITAVTFLAYTKGFTTFSNAKELACYCGVVPFVKKQSGTSIKTKAAVSSFANKKLKWLLHLCAMSAINYDSELKSYYNRKVSEGKNKMSVINAVRNKLVLRMFAVLRDDRDYVENYQKECA